MSVGARRPNVKIAGMADRIARELVVHGRVQGVFFRAFVLEAARRENVAGWAVNRRDGTVGVRLEGAPEAVAAVERACAEGPESPRWTASKRPMSRSGT